MAGLEGARPLHDESSTRFKPSLVVALTLTLTLTLTLVLDEIKPAKAVLHMAWRGRALQTTSGSRSMASPQVSH